MSNRRTEILDSAARVINERGFGHTSVDDLIKACDLSGKSHFYHYFKSKEELGYQVLDRQFQRFTERGLAILAEPMIDPIDRLTLFIDTLVALQRERHVGHGSPFGNLAGELADSNEGFRERLDRVFERWAHQLESLFGELGGQMREGADAARLARFIIAALEGGMLITRVSRNADAMYGIGEDLKRFIAMHLREGEELMRAGVGRELDAAHPAPARREG